MYRAAGGYEAELGVTTSVFRCCVCVWGGGGGGGVGRKRVSIKRMLISQ